MSEHTPGPWTGGRAAKASNFGNPSVKITASDSVGLVTVAVVHAGNGPHNTKEVAEANAKLVAAAPEMLAGLQPFAHFARTWDANPIGGRRLPDDHVVYGIHTGTEWEAHITLGDLRRALAAIAKAEGRHA